MAKQTSLYIGLQNDFSRVITDNLNVYAKSNVLDLYSRIEILWSIISKLRAFMYLEKERLEKSLEKDKKENIKQFDIFIKEIEKGIISIQEIKLRDELVSYEHIPSLKTNTKKIKEVLKISNELNLIRDDLETTILKMGLSTFMDSLSMKPKE